MDSEANITIPFLNLEKMLFHYSLFEFLIFLRRQQEAAPILSLSSKERQVLDSLYEQSLQDKEKFKYDEVKIQGDPYECFSGHSICSSLQLLRGWTKEKAYRVCKHLFKQGVIEEVSANKEGFKDCEEYIYKFESRSLALLQQGVSETMRKENLLHHLERVRKLLAQTKEQIKRLTFLKAHFHDTVASG